MWLYTKVVFAAIVLAALSAALITIPFAVGHFTYEGFILLGSHAGLAWVAGFTACVLSAVVGVTMVIDGPKFLNLEAKHQRKLERKQNKIERLRELRELDEEYERELDRLIE